MTFRTSTSRKRIRQDFGKIRTVIEMPNLIALQRRSYEDFLQMNENPGGRSNKGLESILRSIFPITDHEKRATLEYVHYHLGEKKYSVEEAVRRGVDYAVPLIVTLRLIIWEKPESSSDQNDDYTPDDAVVHFKTDAFPDQTLDEFKDREILNIKEQEVYMGDVPIMTEEGTFIINGSQRVIVSQVHRSPGVFYFHDEGKSNTSGKYIYSARIIPYRGSWLDFEFDSKDLLHFRIDKKRKLYVTTLLMALGYTREDILNDFYQIKTFYRRGKEWVTEFSPEAFRGMRMQKDIVDPDTREILVAKGTRVTSKIIKDFGGQNRFYILEEADIVGTYVSHAISDSLGTRILESGQAITPHVLDYITETMKSEKILVLNIDGVKVGPYIRDTLMVDKNSSKDAALMELYRVLRPGEIIPSIEAAENLLRFTFFAPDRYDLSAVGRMKINHKHNLNAADDITWLQKEDIIACLRHLVSLKDGEGDVDDIDSLSNRRVRSVGELIENQSARPALLKIQRAIFDRMNAIDPEYTPVHDMVSPRNFSGAIKEFLISSQLSQFMDQTNPLSEVTHKRRVSALGPGGLTKERAGFAVRDVHSTHYGRLCPIETPEGQSVGLISSLATYARINQYGFIESPYRRVVEGRVTDEVCYLSAIEEEKYTIAQATAELSPDGKFLNELITCRKKSDFVVTSVAEVDFMDISPKQVVSVAASLIPFLENDDANRASMGSNMQRQAVPLLVNKSPLVGTGMEGVVARDSGTMVLAKRDGLVLSVDANKILVKYNNDVEYGIDAYYLKKYNRLNQNTCLNQKPIVSSGDVVVAGDVLADGACTDLGELALGKDVLVAFLPWKGYNFEDSIIVSEKLVREDAFTSVHIQEYEVIARDTRLGPEEITRALPNVPESSLTHLDESGVARVGATVKEGDILVGKTTNKTESPPTAEEKLLRAIFGEKAAEVQDTSLRMPPGESGTVLSVNILTRHGVEKDERALLIEQQEIERMQDDRDEYLAASFSVFREKAYPILLGARAHHAPHKYKQKIPNDSMLTEQMLYSIPPEDWLDIQLADKTAAEAIHKLKASYESIKHSLFAAVENRIKRLQSGDDLPQGALKVVKVEVATKIKIQPGDKVAGRHGNKGVISKIAPVEDMPFLADGTPVDMILNPLGVPSRMNIGQIMETHLGWASSNLGKQIAGVVEEAQKLGGDEKTAMIRAKLLEIYDRGEDRVASDAEIQELIENMDDKAISELANNLYRGVPMATPVFDGAKQEDIEKALLKAGVAPSGTVELFDGSTGEPFDREVTVGQIYMLKLDHLVDNKIHARSIGPYSLVTQQPLGGKSYFGGQRFGEMEVWAMEGYGAAYTLQEMLTIKSDDVSGRIKAYESIVRGDHGFEFGTPESFKVMLKELRSLCLSVDLIEDDEQSN